MVGSVFALMLASAVGGFALSQYLVTETQEDLLATDAATRARLDHLIAIAERLERATLANSPPLVNAKGEESAPEAGAAPLSPCVITSDLGVQKPCPEPPGPQTVSAGETSRLNSSPSVELATGSLGNTSSSRQIKASGKQAGE
jgi:hypothetical protein